MTSSPPQENSAVIHYEGKGFKLIALKFYCQLCIHISIQTPTLLKGLFPTSILAPLPVGCLWK